MKVVGETNNKVKTNSRLIPHSVDKEKREKVRGVENERRVVVI